MEIVEILAWIPVAAAGISALGSLAGGLFSSAGQASANAANIAQAQAASAQQNSQFEQNLAHARWQSDVQDQRIREGREFEAEQALVNRNWMEEMANSAYQRSMQDMRQAGLNPILAYQQGGAVTPGGAQGRNPGTGSPTSGSGGGATAGRSENTQGELGRALGNVATSAVQAYKDSESARLIRQQEKESQQREVTSSADARLRHWDAEVREREAKGQDIRNDILEEQLKQNRSSTTTAAGEAANMSRYGRREAPDTQERILRSIQGWAEQNGIDPRRITITE